MPSATLFDRSESKPIPPAPGPFAGWVRRPDACGRMGLESPNLSAAVRWWARCAFEDLPTQDDCEVTDRPPAGHDSTPAVSRPPVRTVTDRTAARSRPPLGTEGPGSLATSAGASRRARP
jgi:hypothetical protein